MTIIHTSLPEVRLIEPNVFQDSRGFFLEAWNPKVCVALGLEIGSFVQSNHSRSVSGVLRGLHFQIKRPQGKLIHVVRGQIYDVAVDIRVNSPTYRQWVGRGLSDENHLAMWVPPGFAHGFCVLSEVADVVYHCTEPYIAELDSGIIWCDTDLAIEWPIKDVNLSAKDQRLPTLENAFASGSLPDFRV